MVWEVRHVRAWRSRTARMRPSVSRRFEEALERYGAPETFNTDQGKGNRFLHIKVRTLGVNAVKDGQRMIDHLKKLLHWDRMSPDEKNKYKAAYRGTVEPLLWLGSLFRIRLRVLAKLARTDKGGAHNYTSVYERHFRKFRNKRISLLEIGVGGYSLQPGGGSLRMWRAYFPYARIAAIDIYDKTRFSRGRVKVYQCSQIDGDGLREICEEYDGFDIIIDDGSHINEHQIETFGTLFDHLNDGGIYVIEDVQTSYWPAYGGGAVGTSGYEQSSMCFFKQFADGLNYEEFLDEHYAPTAYDRKIISIEFHHNLIILTKGRNEEGSQMIERFREELFGDCREDGTLATSENTGRFADS